MTVTVVPLDPASPAGIAMAARLTEVLGELQAAVWLRQAARPTPSQPDPRQPTPVNPSRPPSQPTRPSGPTQPPRHGSAVHKLAAQPALHGGSGAAVHSGSRSALALAGTPSGAAPRT